MPERKTDTKGKIAVFIWLCLVSGIAATKVILGSLSLDGGCLGLKLLPYYFLFGGLLGLTPALMTITIYCCRQTDTLKDMWSLVIKLFACWMILLISGTMYIVIGAVRVTSVDKLCSQSWLVILGFCLLTADWLTFMFLYHQFCKWDRPQETRPEFHSQPLEEDSPFYLWRMRRQRDEL